MINYIKSSGENAPIDEKIKFMLKKIDAHWQNVSFSKKIFFEIFDKLPIKNPED